MLGPDGGKAAGLVLKTSPHRVMLSPIARVEVYVAIPGPAAKARWVRTRTCCRS